MLWGIDLHTLLGGYDFWGGRGRIVSLFILDPDQYVVRKLRASVGVEHAGRNGDLN